LFKAVERAIARMQVQNSTVIVQSIGTGTGYWNCTRILILTVTGIPTG
jgi:hypothetical protein